MPARSKTSVPKEKIEAKFTKGIIKWRENHITYSKR